MITNKPKRGREGFQFKNRVRKILMYDDKIVDGFLNTITGPPNRFSAQLVTVFFLPR